MSSSDQRAREIAELASAFSAACAEAIEDERLSDVPDDSLGQVMASVIRLYAAKVQNGETPRAIGRNSGVSITDVAIGCTGLMDAVGLETFELGAWQSMSGLGRK